VNRRATPRALVEVEVDLESESHFFTGLTGDLSRGGIFIATYRPLAVDERLDLRFVLPNGSVEARGRVCWLRHATSELGPGAGVAFEDLSDESRATIEHFCREREPLYYDLGDRPSSAG
jgi:uncharacterized protein (TIGR02266 family)